MLDDLKKILAEKGEAYFRVKARTNASSTIIKQVFETESNIIVKIDLAAEPVKGKANQELVRYLAQEFDVSRENVKIISGKGEKNKLVKIVRF